VSQIIPTEKSTVTLGWNSDSLAACGFQIGDKVSMNFCYMTRWQKFKKWLKRQLFGEPKPVVYTYTITAIASSTMELKKYD